MTDLEKTKLINLMLDKSQESFLLAIEIYNKPTIKFRVEGFCFFVCNAWEMLLKAHLLNTGNSIYYKDKKLNQNRTISLTDCIKKVLTNNKDPLRKNLEVVVGIRNMANHLVIPEYASMMNDVFMACVKNYTTKLKAYFDITIDNKIQTDYITMFIPRESRNVDIEGKYGKDIFKKYIDTRTFLNHTYTENANDKNIVNDVFALSYELTFKTVSDVNAADFTVSKVAPSKSQLGVIKVKEKIDPSKTHPFTYSQIVSEVNKEMNEKGLTFTPISENAKKTFTTNTFNCLNRMFNFKNDEIYSFKHQVGNHTFYTYSYKLIQRIINIFTDNPDILIKNKKC